MSPPNLKELLNAWADGEPPQGAAERFLSAGLRAATAAYRAGNAVRSLAFDLGLRRAKRVDCPVICIGNLSVGGTGKTPVVMWAARHFRNAGRRAAIVSRGFKRSAGSPVLLVSDGEKVLVSRDEAGDEPLLMAKSLEGVAVVVGARRYEAARLAREQCGADVILLDDGFQHRSLARDCDIVLWDALRPSEASAFLPRGFLREGPGALRRAHALVFTRCNLGKPSRCFVAQIKRAAPHLLLFHASLAPGVPRRLDEPDRLVSLESLAGRRIGAFCGLGNPQSFWKLLETTGAALVWKHAFPDHYRPARAELDGLLERARRAGAEHVFTTEKDLENLPESWQPKLPASVLPALVEFGEDTERFQAFLDRAAEIQSLS